MMSNEPWSDMAEGIRAALARPLPGRSSQETMMPASRRGLPAPPAPEPSAVLLALVAGNSGVPAFVLVERESGGPHGGQIAFPGGKREAGDSSMVETALREAREEVGIDPASVDVLGLLSALTIPVSGFLVQPVVGIVSGAPALRPNPGEIASVFEVPLAELMRPGNKQEREVFSRGQSHLVPCYVFGDAIVWGATAMMLAEFEAVLSVTKLMDGPLSVTKLMDGQAPGLSS